MELSDAEITRLLREVNNLRMVAGAAKRLMETLGGPEGYFPTAGEPITDTLRRCLVQAGYKMDYKGGSLRD